MSLLGISACVGMCAFNLPRTYIPINAHTHKHNCSGISSSIVCSDTAASAESLQCIQILQTYGADFGGKSVHRATPMHKAAAGVYVGPSVCLCMFDLWILVCDRVIPGHS